MSEKEGDMGTVCVRNWVHGGSLYEKQGTWGQSV